MNWLRFTTLLAVLKRDEEDARTIGELFYLMVSEVADVTYQEAMLILATAMLTSLEDVFRISEEQAVVLYMRFIQKLPNAMQHLLQIS